MGVYKTMDLETKSGTPIGVYETRKLKVSKENFGSVQNKNLERKAGIHTDAVNNKIIRDYFCVLDGCCDNQTQYYRCLYVRVKVKFTLEQDTKAQKGSRGIVLHFL